MSDYAVFIIICTAIFVAMLLFAGITATQYSYSGHMFSLCPASVCEIIRRRTFQEAFIVALALEVLMVCTAFVLTIDKNKVEPTMAVTQWAAVGQKISLRKDFHSNLWRWSASDYSKDVDVQSVCPFYGDNPYEDSPMKTLTSYVVSIRNGLEASIQNVKDNDLRMTSMRIYDQAGIYSRYIQYAQGDLPSLSTTFNKKGVSVVIYDANGQVIGYVVGNSFITDTEFVLLNIGNVAAMKFMKINNGWDIVVIDETIADRILQPAFAAAFVGYRMFQDYDPQVLTRCKDLYAMAMNGIVCGSVVIAGAVIIVFVNYIRKKQQQARTIPTYPAGILDMMPPPRTESQIDYSLPPNRPLPPVPLPPSYDAVVIHIENEIARNSEATHASSEAYYTEAARNSESFHSCELPHTQENEAASTGDPQPPTSPRPPGTPRQVRQINSPRQSSPRKQETPKAQRLGDVPTVD